MLRVGRTQARETVGTRIVGAFALAHGIESEHYEPKLHQSLATALIRVRSFAVHAVPHLEQHAWERSRPRFGNVKIRRDEFAGTAFIDQFLDAIFLAFETARCPNLERRALRDASNQLPESCASPLLPAVDSVRGGQPLYFRHSSRVRFGSQTSQYVGQASRVVPVFLRKSGCGGRRKKTQ